MSSTINNQISETVRHHAQAEKRGQERIAHAHRTAAKGKVGKDYVLPSTGDTKPVLPKKGETKPKLPTPKTPFSGLKGDDQGEEGKTMGLIAIIGEVMALQAKSNSNFWSTMWKQASTSMMMQVKFAPVIAKAIKCSYEAQAQSTQAQATSARLTGTINLVMFGATVVIGTYMGLRDETGESGPSQNDAKATEETAQAGADAQSAELEESGNNEKIAEQRQNDELADEVRAQETNGKKAQIKGAFKKMQEIGGKGPKLLSTILTKFSHVSSGMTMLANGGSSLVDAQYKSIQSEKQEEEGQAQALNKESEQYAQFYGQSFSRSEDLRQGGQQNIDYAMNILKSSVDTITQTITSMFRG
ncbi:MAG: hypothetical protein S4CHLAM2_04990 [Chlamydiales bacterium]|nr:hypothetical protein [Chlamydiales bacterium]